MKVNVITKSSFPVVHWLFVHELFNTIDADTQVVESLISGKNLHSSSYPQL